MRNTFSPLPPCFCFLSGESLKSKSCLLNSTNSEFGLFLTSEACFVYTTYTRAARSPALLAPSPARTYAKRPAVLSSFQEEVRAVPRTEAAAAARRGGCRAVLLGRLAVGAATTMRRGREGESSLPVSHRPLFGLSAPSRLSTPQRRLGSARLGSGRVGSGRAAPRGRPAGPGRAPGERPPSPGAALRARGTGWGVGGGAGSPGTAPGRGTGRAPPCGAPPANGGPRASGGGAGGGAGSGGDPGDGGGCCGGGAGCAVGRAPHGQRGGSAKGPRRPGCCLRSAAALR